MWSQGITRRPACCPRSSWIPAPGPVAYQVQVGSLACAVISRGDDGPAPSVIPAERAPRAVAPSGKAAVRLLAQGSNAFLGELSMDAGAAVPEHADTTEEYIHVLEGGGTMTIDGQVHTISAGTTVFMPAGATVSYQNGDAPLRALQVFAGPAPASKYDAWTQDG